MAMLGRSFFLQALLLLVASPLLASLAAGPKPTDSTVCPPGTTCSSKTLSCPNQCPQQKPDNPKAKGCFLDCNSPTCEGGTCLNRKANCNGNGAACYDPRFVGGDGMVFFFHGKAGHHFTLVSDHAFQINARFIGRRPEGRTRDFTWIQSLGILFGDGHSFTLEAVKTADWDDAEDRLAFTYDGRPVHVEESYLSSWTAPEGGLEVERLSSVNSVSVVLRDAFEIKATVVPVTSEDDRVHRYGIPADDCFAHLEVQFKFLKLSGDVEGVLGQTYRPDFRSPVKRGVDMPIMGGEQNYVTGSLVSTSCKKCIFSPENAAVGEHGDDSSVLEMPSSMECGSKMGGAGYGVACRR